MLLWASGSKKAGVAVICCDWKEKLIKACVKQITSCSPCYYRSFCYRHRSIATATSSRNKKKIVVEGDSKVCINGFVKEAENPPLEIIIMLEDIKSLSSAFDSCSSKWIRRNANDMACTWCKWNMINNFSSCIMEIT